MCCFYSLCFQDEIFVFDFMKKLEDGVQKAVDHNTVVDVNLFLSVLITAVSVGCNNPELFVKNIKGNCVIVFNTKLYSVIFFLQFLLNILIES